MVCMSSSADAPRILRAGQVWPHGGTGATVVRATADRPADGLTAFAKREGITHVIFGQTARTRWETLVNGSTLNRFLDEVRDAAVQVVPLGE
jgi:two-component system, OmpR family, sensor histidine kinase KdpD